ncbi:MULTISPECIES: pyocin activator PrtN family protein [Xenorhabdus]|uniref:pyocin activator PrtN family protein n=1 Tax=Xenorhabdus TaxID=626 RepID=UPI00064B500B|nr:MULTISPECIES: pyocin activator PrtN family protein [Xenorhabdus]KLU14098.1 pyocin activator protein PrtN, phage related protein [Xenorhabdus griffiniae]KOP34676.1 pyocin activator protein PrtN, phage related protein [Xenorhabdus sp. GDc328]
MNTTFLLMAEFETSQIPLSAIAERYLKMSPGTAERKANEGKLNIPTYKLTDSQKSPRIVHVNDLAAYIDEQRELAAKEIERIHFKRQAN